MKDQADKLRKIVSDYERAAVMPETKEGLRIITVTGGKGGVGKSSFTANLALCLRDWGYRVLILDADFGLANIDVMLGVTPKYNFSHFLDRSKSMEDIISEGPKGVKFISGGSGVYELMHISQEQLNLAIYELSCIEKMFDILLIDTGAGVSDVILRFILSSHETILVTTPEPTSIVDAYALLKSARNIPKSRGLRFHVLVNKADSEKEAQKILENLADVALRFLQTRIDPLGYILSDDTVTRSIKLQVPFMLEYPKSAAAKAIRRIAGQLLKHPAETAQDNNLTKLFKRFAQAWKTAEGRTDNEQQLHTEGR
jgi:flagellar biosynthesis protein FlhG